MDLNLVTICHATHTSRYSGGRKCVNSGVTRTDLSRASMHVHYGGMAVQSVRMTGGPTV
jgi:hypothetical protein